MEPRKTFAPAVLLGLAASGFAALAGNRVMLQVPKDHLTDSGLSPLAGQGYGQVEFPLAGALALVALAGWGVLLVTRGVVRRAVAALALVAAAGIAAVLVIGGFLQIDNAADDVRQQLGVQAVVAMPLDRTVWFWVGLAASLVAVAASAVALRFVPSWPEMGSRYDAPGTPRNTEAATDATGERSNLDLWKSLDEGTDPTADPAEDGTP